MALEITALSNGRVKVVDTTANGTSYFSNENHAAQIQGDNVVIVNQARTLHPDFGIPPSQVTTPAGPWTAEALCDLLNASPYFFKSAGGGGGGITSVDTLAPITGTGVNPDPVRIDDGTLPDDTLLWDGAQWVIDRMPYVQDVADNLAQHPYRGCLFQFLDTGLDNPPTSASWRFATADLVDAIGRIRPNNSTLRILRRVNGLLSGAPSLPFDGLSAISLSTPVALSVGDVCEVDTTADPNVRSTLDGRNIWDVAWMPSGAIKPSSTPRLCAIEERTSGERWLHLSVDGYTYEHKDIGAGLMPFQAAYTSAGNLFVAYNDGVVVYGLIGSTDGGQTFGADQAAGLSPGPFWIDGSDIYLFDQSSGSVHKGTISGATVSGLAELAALTPLIAGAGGVVQVGGVGYGLVFVAAGQSLFVSNDGGASWSDVSITPAPMGQTYAVCAMSASGWLVGGDYGIYATTDGGASWTHVFAETVLCRDIVLIGSVAWAVTFKGLLRFTDPLTYDPHSTYFDSDGLANRFSGYSVFEIWLIAPQVYPHPRGINGNPIKYLAGSGATDGNELVIGTFVSGVIRSVPNPDGTPSNGARTNDLDVYLQTTSRFYLR